MTRGWVLMLTLLYGHITIAVLGDPDPWYSQWTGPPPVEERSNEFVWKGGFPAGSSIVECGTRKIRDGYHQVRFIKAEINSSTVRGGPPSPEVENYIKKIKEDCDEPGYLIPTAIGGAGIIHNIVPMNVAQSRPLADFKLKVEENILSFLSKNNSTTVRLSIAPIYGGNWPRFYSDELRPKIFPVFGFGPSNYRESTFFAIITNPSCSEEPHNIKRPLTPRPRGTADFTGKLILTPWYIKYLPRNEDAPWSLFANGTYVPWMK